MIKNVEVVNFLGYMGRGISRPVLVICDNFKEYILKNESVDENGKIVKYNCMFVNELLAYQIACYLGIPIPEAVVAYVDSKFINNDPAIRFKYRFEEGNHFATEKLPYVENNILEGYEQLSQMGKPYITKSWNKFFELIHNKEDIAGIIAFDILIANFDRVNNLGNILIDKTNETRKIYAIDHGHAFFGPKWTSDKINCLNNAKLDNTYIGGFLNCFKLGLNGLGEIFRALEKHINIDDINNHSFMEVVQKIESIDENLIDRWLQNIPDEWYIDKNYQISIYKRFLLDQKSLVRHILQSMATNSAFSNYRGGILEWKEQQNTKFHTV